MRKGNFIRRVDVDISFDSDQEVLDYIPKSKTLEHDDLFSDLNEEKLFKDLRIRPSGRKHSNRPPLKPINMKSPINPKVAFPNLESNRLAYKTTPSPF